MMKGKKVFIDSDVLLDVILERAPHYFYSNHITALAETNYFKGFTSALILANCHYILTRHFDKNTANEALSLMRSFLDILPTSDKEIGESLISGFKDFEDGIQYYTALNHGMDALITRNRSDFNCDGINIYTPKEFISEL
jgi:predicted nucleic acid-binding protein